MRRWIIVAAALAVVVVAWRVFGGQAPDDAPPLRFGLVDRGDVVRSVAATGRLEPVGAVEVGSQLSGQIAEVLVDFNDPVEQGQIIARLDPSTFAQRVLVDEADLAVQRANLTAAEAQLTAARADLRAAEREHQRQQDLETRGVSSVSALDAALAARDRARASVNTAEANVEVAGARVTQAEAALENARIDLERASIRAPTDGVVINRTVENGQTVAASLQAPVLFTIAEGLDRMRVEIRVDEADIGEVRQGLPVRFTVDAYVDQTFEGDVVQVRINPTVEQSVVTYTVVAETPNPRLSLLPGMTANAEIILEERTDVLRVPNAALRWTPADAPREDARPAGPGARAGFGGRGGGGGGRLARLTAALELTEEQQAQVEPIVAEASAAMRAAFQEAQASGDMSAVRGRAGQAMQTALAQIRPLLTEAQRERLDALQGRARERRGDQARRGVVWVEGAGGRLERVVVSLGAQDAERSEVLEVLQGPLADGDAVITGGGDQAAPAQTGGRRGGFRRGGFP